MHKKRKKKLRIEVYDINSFDLQKIQMRFVVEIIVRILVPAIINQIFCNTWDDNFFFIFQTFRIEII